MALHREAAKTPKSFLRRERRKGGFGVLRNLGGGAQCVIFSERDMTILRLLCWCQYVLPEDLDGLAAKTELHNLIRLGFIKQHEKSGALSLTKAGGAFLFEAADGALPKVSHPYHAALIQRRLRVSRVALTAYQAGANVFTMSPEGLSDPFSFFLSAVTRSRGSNPWGSTRVAALAHLGDLLCALHFVCPGIGKLALTDELTAFNNQTAVFQTVQRALVFAGDSYQDVLKELEEPRPEADTKLVYYGDAYRCVQLPVYLLSCDDTGAAQLQIMATPNYRQRFTKAALKANYQPPPKDVPMWDAIFQKLPFVMAADMDLRRIDAALKTAYERGYPQIVLVALEGQADAVLLPRYRDTGKARVFLLKPDALAEGLGHPQELCTPARTQYLTGKGDVIDAPPIQAAGKAGGHRRP